MLHEHLCCSEGQEKSHSRYASSQPLVLNEEPVLLVNEGKSVESPESDLKGTESNGLLQDSREEQEGEEIGKGRFSERETGAAVAILVVISEA